MIGIRPGPLQGTAIAPYHRPPMDTVGPPEIMRILAVTDALGFHREAVAIPLWPKGKGEIRTRGAKLEISAPAEGDFEAWLAALPAQLRSMELSSVRRA
jgi:hypothetical protein